MSSQLALACPAKVNLALSVGPRDEQGYHAIASWMAALTFADALTLERRAGTSTFDFVDAGAGPIDWPVPSDLAFRAHQLMQRHVNRPLPVRATLRKVIPTGAGLGGGSSDAAAMLVALDALFELGCDTRTLVELGGTLGSDVPFLVRAIRGEPAAVVTGRGESLEPVPLAAPIDLVLVLPELHCATGAVYAAFDAMKPNAGPPDEARVHALAAGGGAGGGVAAQGLFNDLAAAAERVAPRLGETRKRVSELAEGSVHITGSGAAMFILAGSPDEAARLASRITARTGLRAVATRTASPDAG